MVVERLHPRAEAHLRPRLVPAETSEKPFIVRLSAHAAEDEFLVRVAIGAWERQLERQDTHCERDLREIGAVAHYRHLATEDARRLPLFRMKSKEELLEGILFETDGQELRRIGKAGVVWIERIRV